MSHSIKTAIVTGATGGIGSAITEYLIDSGYYVIALGRDKSKLKHLSENNRHNNIKTYAIDFDEPQKIDAALTKILAAHPKIDLLINNAGYVKRGTSDLSENEFMKMMNINLISVFSLTRKIIPIMKNNRMGRIINISSLSGVQARSSLGGYAASKQALMALNASLHLELAEFGINVTAICPNLVDTNMTQDVTSIDRHKMVPVSDVVSTVNYLINLSSKVSISEIVLRCKEKMIKDNKG